MQVYDSIERLCSKQGISIRKLEIKAGVGNGVIGRWRFRTPKLATLQKVADALGVPLIAILYGDGN